MMKNLCFILFITIVILYNKQIDATQPTRLAKAIDVNEWENVMRKQLSNTCTRGRSEPIWEGKMITESYCRCPDGTYGFDCSEQFENPCHQGKNYHAADISLANNYFIKCMGNVPHLMKCPVRTIWNQKILTCDWGRVRQGIPRVKQAPPPQDLYYDRKNTYPTLLESQPYNSYQYAQPETTTVASLVQSPVQNSYGYEQPQQNVVESAVPVTSHQDTSYNQYNQYEAQKMAPVASPVLEQQPVQQTYNSYQQSYDSSSYNYPTQQKLADIIIPTTPAPLFNLDLAVPKTQTYDSYPSYGQYSQPSNKVEPMPFFESFVTTTTTVAPIVKEIPVQNYHDYSYNYAPVQNSYSYDTSNQAKFEPVIVQTTTMSSFLDLQPVLDQHTDNSYQSYYSQPSVQNSYESQSYAPTVNAAPVVKETPRSNYNDNSYSYPQPAVSVQNSYSYDSNNQYGQASQAKIEPVIVQTTTVTSFLDLQPVLDQHTDNSYQSSSYYPQPSLQGSYHSSSYDYLPTTTAAPIVKEIPVQSYQEVSYNYAQPAAPVQNSYSYDSNNQYGQQANQAKIEPVIVQTTTASSFLDLQPVLDQHTDNSYQSSSYYPQPSVQGSYHSSSYDYLPATTAAPIVNEIPVQSYQNNNYAQPPVPVQNSYESQSYAPTVNAAPVVKETPAQNYNDNSYNYAQPAAPVQNSYSYDSNNQYGQQANQAKIEPVIVQTTTTASILSQPANSYGSSYSQPSSQDSYYGSSYGSPTEYNIYTASSNSYGYDYLSKTVADAQTKSEIENKKSHVFDFKIPTPVENVAAAENTIENVENEENVISPVFDSPVVEKSIPKRKTVKEHVVNRVKLSPLVEDTSSIIIQTFNNTKSSKVGSPSVVTIDRKPVSNILFQALPKLNSISGQKQQQPYMYPQVQAISQPKQQIPLQNNLLQSLIMPVQQQQQLQPQRFAPNVIQSAPIQPVQQQQQQSLGFAQNVVQSAPINPTAIQPVTIQQQVTTSPMVKSSLNLIKLLTPIVSSSQLNAGQQAFKIDIPFDKSAADPNCPLPNGVSIGVNLSLF